MSQPQTLQPQVTKNHIMNVSAPKCTISLLNTVLTHLQMRMTGGYPTYFQTGKKPTESQILKTREIVQNANLMLNQMATVEEISTQFSLLSSGMKTTQQADSHATAAAYLIALEGFSSWSIRQSVKDILQGKVKGLSKTFMPSAPELANYCTTLEQSMKAKIKTIERLLNAKEEVLTIAKN